MRKKTSKTKIIRIIAWVFLVLQLFGYLGNLNQKTKIDAEPTEMFGYYIGLNLDSKKILKPKDLSRKNSSHVWRCFQFDSEN